MNFQNVLAVTLAAVIVMIARPSRAVEYIWDASGDGISWNDPLNYTGDSGFPNAPGDIFNTSGSTPTTIYLNQNVTIGQFIDTTWGNHNFDIVPSGGDFAITWDTGTAEDALFLQRRLGTACCGLRTSTSVDMILQSSLLWDGTTQRNLQHLQGDISGPGKLTVQWNENGDKFLTIDGGDGPNTHQGGTEFAANFGTDAVFMLNKTHATGWGDTTVDYTATIVIPFGDVIKDDTDLYVLSNLASDYGMIE